MVSRVNDNNSFRPIDESNKEQEIKSTGVGSGEQGLITEIGIPAADLKNAERSSALTAEGKNVMNMRAGLLQKQLNEELSNKQPQSITMMDYEGNPVVTYSSNGKSEIKDSVDRTEAYQKEPANVEVPN